jgi:hypothetical protein
MPSPHDDFFLFYRTEFLPAYAIYAIADDWIESATVDVNAEAVKIFTSLANSSSEDLIEVERDKHLRNADQALRDLTVLCYYFYSLSFESYFIKPIIEHSDTSKSCITVPYSLFQTRIEEFKRLSENAQEATLIGQDPLRNDIIRTYKEIADLSVKIRGYIRQTELDRLKSKWATEEAQETKALLDRVVEGFSQANAKDFASKHPFLLLLAGALITYFVELIGPKIFPPTYNFLINATHTIALINISQ